MNRRSFIKRLGGFLSLAYVNPIALIPDTIKESSYIEFTIAHDDVHFLGDFAETIIKPAMKKLVDDMDKHMFENLIKGVKNGSSIS